MERIRSNATAVVMPQRVHEASRTYKNRNKSLYPADSGDLRSAADRDLLVLRINMQAEGYSGQEIDKIISSVHEANRKLWLY